jgi:hypothetical protein
MTNFYSTNENLIHLYEVTDPQGVAIWGGEKIEDMFDWYWRSPEGARVFISAWNSNDEDAYMVGRPIEVTAIVGSKVGEGK